VHATEIRWLLFDKSTGEIGVYWVNFPAAWNQAARDLEDHEYPASEDWLALFATYQAKGLMSGQVLLDGLADVEIEADEADALDARQVMFNIQCATSAEPVSVLVTSTIRSHEVPVS